MPPFDIESVKIHGMKYPATSSALIEDLQRQIQDKIVALLILGLIINHHKNRRWYPVFSALLPSYLAPDHSIRLWSDTVVYQQTLTSAFLLSRSPSSGCCKSYASSSRCRKLLSTPSESHVWTAKSPLRKYTSRVIAGCFKAQILETDQESCKVICLWILQPWSLLRFALLCSPPNP